MIFVDFCEMNFGVNPIGLSSLCVGEHIPSLAWLFDLQNSLGAIFSKSVVLPLIKRN